MARTSTKRQQRNTQSAEREAQLHVALDNMPGALVYTDEDLNIVICNQRFTEMYPTPRSCSNQGSPTPISYVTWLSMAITAKAMSRLSSPSG